MARKKAIDLLRGRAHEKPVDAQEEELAKGGVSVEKVSARELTTVGENDPYWTGGPDPIVRAECLLRLVPPPGTPRSKVDALLVRVGNLPAAVKVLPCAATEQVSVVAGDVVLELETAREAVLALVEESNHPEKESLRKLCEAAMAKVAL